MNPKLTRASVTIYFRGSNGYACTTRFAVRDPQQPAKIPLLDAFEEIGRLAALFGFAAEAQQRFDDAQRRVDEDLATRERNHAA